MPPHKPEFLLYFDESGSRDPDRNKRESALTPDWFGIGGILVNATDKPEIEAKMSAFRESWPQMGLSPFRSYDIRNRTKGFRWLSQLDDKTLNNFYDELSATIASLPIVVTGCVVHRPGYNERYLVRYGPRRWKLCKTAFHIAVERAAKYALHYGARMRVYVERRDKVTETQLKGYFDEMRNAGQPFNTETSAKYQPMTADQLRSTLFEFDVRTKESALMQVADLVLWPICRGRYAPDDRAYCLLQSWGKLLDAHCTEANGLLGIKYFCF
jgi:Protein of unknown function (DUF3800)